ncbi:Uncharacterized protein Adt_31471 [Abeliophyllum distichum]|uniref:Uncharacterized protein n=1 Tax=Abeliophyllum distichum TaxID=126358 RepID=A0ABD1RE78_9LAMI
MSVKVTEGEASWRVGDETSPLVSPSMADVLPIRGIDIFTGEEMAIASAPRLAEARKLPRKKGKEEELGWYYFCPWGAHKPLVKNCPYSIKQWKESWFWVTGNWHRVVDDLEPNLDIPGVYEIANSLPRCELSRDIIEVIRLIYQASLLNR